VLEINTTYPLFMNLILIVKTVDFNYNLTPHDQVCIH